MMNNAQYYNGNKLILVLFLYLALPIMALAGGSITGTMYHDIDGNGVKNGIESGIAPNITVFLLDSNGSPIFGPSGFILATTDANGDYLMTDVPVDTYQLLVAIEDTNVPAGYLLSTQELILGVGVVEGEENGANDFGYDAVGDITGILYLDQNANNTNDGETRMGANLTVSLLDYLGNPVQDDSFNDITTTTNNVGAYRFEEVLVDTGYQVKVDPMDAELPARTGLGTASTIRYLTVTRGNTNSDNNFGYDEYVSLFGTLFKDEDFNNSMNGADTGLGAGLVISLNYDDGSPVMNSGNPVTAISNSFGNYSFIDVNANLDYQIEVDPNDVNIPNGYQLGTSSVINNVSPSPGFNMVGLNFGYDAVPLSIELVDFIAMEETCQIRLNWTTSQEYKNEVFEIERSRDGIVFEKIGEVAGSGTTNDYRHYSFIDDQAFSNNYYRLQQKDFGGTFSFSEVITISFLCIEEDLKIGIANLYPNPVWDDDLTVKLIAKDPITTELMITDLYGKIYRKESIQLTTGTNTIVQTISALPAGIYFIQVENTSKKFVRLRN